MLLMPDRNPLPLKRALFVIMMTIDINAMIVDHEHAATQNARPRPHSVPVSGVNP
jgi:hypothetical protein